jgi:hypothetical protein
MKNQLLRMVFVATVFLGAFTFWLSRTESAAQTQVPVWRGKAP